MLGTTFGGNHLACAAGISVLDVIEKERLMENVNKVSAHFLEKINEIAQIKAVKGKGLMLGVTFDFPVAQLRKQLIFEEGIFTGGSSDPNLLRILPPLSIETQEIDFFIAALKSVLKRMSDNAISK